MLARYGTPMLSWCRTNRNSVVMDPGHCRVKVPGRTESADSLCHYVHRGVFVDSAHNCMSSVKDHWRSVVMRLMACHVICPDRTDSTVWARDMDASQYAELHHFQVNEAKWHKVNGLARSMNHSFGSC